MKCTIVTQSRGPIQFVDAERHFVSSCANLLHWRETSCNHGQSSRAKYPEKTTEDLAMGGIVGKVAGKL